MKVSAAGAALGANGFDFALRPSVANAAEVAATYHTTCPYCSACCGQLVDVDASGNVLDIYGDPRSPFNVGALCAKGASGFQLVTNTRRIGAWTGSHPVNSVFAADGTSNGVAYRRVGNGDWERMSLDTAFSHIASGWSGNDGTGASGVHTGLLGARGAVTEANGYNSKGVAFLGSSHINNEQNYLYRKLIADFGSSNVEHQARI